MSTPTTPTPAARPDIAAFVEAVRSELDDLSDDEIAELTGGLEADLTDELAESGQTPAQRYGGPGAYAQELRAAAGLPPRSDGGGGRGRTEFADLPGLWRRFVADVQSQFWWPRVRDFAVVLRPVWWVLRAWVLVQAALQLLVGGDARVVAGGLLGFFVLALAIIASVELGRRSASLDSRRRTALTVLNVVAVLALGPVVDQATQPGYVTEYSAPPPGIALDGTAVTNVFPYDADGHPLSGVQLYDQSGRPLNVGESDRTQFDDNGTEVDLLPGTAAGTPQRWNVYPLRERRFTTGVDSNGNVVPGPAEEARAPFAAVPPLLAAPVPSASVTPSASPAPSSSASPGPSSPAPTATPTPTPTGK